jgi:hypothetical protein
MRNRMEAIPLWAERPTINCPTVLSAAGVLQDYNVISGEADTLESGRDYRSILVGIGEQPDLAWIGSIGDDERQPGLGIDRKGEQYCPQNQLFLQQQASTPLVPAAPAAQASDLA